MERKYQVTLYDNGGHYKPVSTIVIYKEGMTRKDVVHKGTEQICIRRRWTKNDVIRYNYLTYKIKRVEENE